MLTILFSFVLNVERICRWCHANAFLCHFVFWINTVCPLWVARSRQCQCFFPSQESRSLLTERLSVFLPTDVSVSLLSLLVTTCGLALFSVSLFVSWKLCWVPLSGRFLPDVLKGAHFLGGDQQPVLIEVSRKSDFLLAWLSNFAHLPCVCMDCL